MNKRRTQSQDRGIRNFKSDHEDRSLLLAQSIVDDDDDDHKHVASDVRGDRINIAILFFLYLLQGIPLGLTAAIPMVLQNRGASYKDQAEFSFAHWPFSLKLLWAPIVDSLYWSKFGRRKSWLIPTQYFLGIAMLVLSSYVDQWIGGNGREPNIRLLTGVFFALNFLGATQDIAVDGWALTMLKKCNVGHASTCNSVGQTAGYFFGYVAFIALESAEFCNSYLRSVPQEDGLVTLPGFLWFWGICFMITTSLVAIFKRESVIINDKTRYSQDEDNLDIGQTYKLLLDILKMRPIKILIAVLLTVKVTFSACDAVSQLKLIDAGVPKDKLALLVVPMIPLQIILPLVISKYTTGPRPMEVYLKAFPYRIIFASLAGLIVWMTPFFIVNGHVPIYYYVILIINYAFYQVFLYSMFVAIMAFFAKISDPGVGGTYMTLLNTICNMGNNWPSTIVLWLVDTLTWKNCINSSVTEEFECSSKINEEKCIASNGQCVIKVDGYYIELIACIVYGILWYRWGTRKIHYLQNLPLKEWRIMNRPKTKKTQR